VLKNHLQLGLSFKFVSTLLQVARTFIIIVWLVENENFLTPKSCGSRGQPCKMKKTFAPKYVTFQVARTFVIWLVENDFFFKNPRIMAPWPPFWNDKLLHPRVAFLLRRSTFRTSRSNFRNLTCWKWFFFFKSKNYGSTTTFPKWETFTPESYLSFEEEEHLPEMTNFYTRELPFEGHHHLASSSNLHSLTCRKWKLLHPRDVDVVPSSTNEHTRSTPSS
jgi:hypothetical protein